MIKLICILAISYISLSDACSCAFMVGWERQAVCNSAFSGLIKVEGPQYNCGSFKICYPITVIQQYLGAPATPTVLETASDGAMCGVGLSAGHSYFVATNPIDENKIGVYLCSLYRDWTDLTCCEMIEEAKKYRCDGTPILGPIELEPVIQNE